MDNKKKLRHHRAVARNTAPAGGSCAFGRRISAVIAVIAMIAFSTTLFAAAKPKPKPKPKPKAVHKKADFGVRIDQPYSVKFPDMKVYISVVNKKQEPLLSLVRGNFSVYIDGRMLTSKLDVAGFQYTEEGTSFALLVAGNGLMEGEAIEAQKQAAVNLSEFIREQDRLSVFLYAADVKPVIEFEKKNESIVQKINKIDVLGSNPHLYDVLVYAARRMDESTLTRKVIIIMSDGRDIGSRFTEKQLLDVLDEKNIPVYSIGIKLMSGQNLYRLATISNHSGGEYIYADNLKNISDCIRIIYNQVSLGYVLSFEADSLKADNKIHQLQVKVQNKGEEASFYKNFVAVKVPMSYWVIGAFVILGIIVVLVIVILLILRLRRVRKQMGITKRECPECGKLLKDDWDECLFCKHNPPKKKTGLIQKLMEKKP